MNAREYAELRQHRKCESEDCLIWRKSEEFTIAGPCAEAAAASIDVEGITTCGQASQTGEGVCELTQKLQSRIRDVKSYRIDSHARKSIIIYESFISIYFQNTMKDESIIQAQASFIDIVKRNFLDEISQMRNFIILPVTRSRGKVDRRRY